MPEPEDRQKQHRPAAVGVRQIADHRPAQELHGRIGHEQPAADHRRIGDVPARQSSRSAVGRTGTMMPIPIMSRRTVTRTTTRALPPARRGISDRSLSGSFAPPSSDRSAPVPAAVNAAKRRCSAIEARAPQGRLSSAAPGLALLVKTAARALRGFAPGCCGSGPGRGPARPDARWRAPDRSTYRPRRKRPQARQQQEDNACRRARRRRCAARRPRRRPARFRLRSHHRPTGSPRITASARLARPRRPDQRHGAVARIGRARDRGCIRAPRCRAWRER